jgi:hypothetical protein
MMIRLESPKDFKADYEKCKTHEDLHGVNAKKIIELKRIIKNLWTQIIFSDKKNITVIDLRNEDHKKN